MSLVASLSIDVLPWCSVCRVSPALCWVGVPLLLPECCSCAEGPLPFALGLQGPLVQLVSELLDVSVLA